MGAGRENKTKERGREREGEKQRERESEKRGEYLLHHSPAGRLRDLYLRPTSLSSFLELPTTR
jgi:hypothetical protein